MLTLLRVLKLKRLATYLAIENDLELIPVLNKIDIPNANIEETLAEIVDLTFILHEDCLQASAKLVRDSGSSCQRVSPRQEC